jgi:flagellar basal body-associated protein FliL
MSSRARRGQVFIIIIVIIIILVALFVIVPMLEARNRPAPLMKQVFWQANNQNVTNVYLGEEVELHAVVKATEQYTGSVVVKVRKDVADWFDSDYTVKTFPLNLVGDQIVELELTFSPDEATQGRFRGYFVEIQFSASNTKWVMDDSYPPRLEVLVLQPGTNTSI